MRHVCEPLSLDELEEAFNSQTMNVDILNIIEICDKHSPGFDDRVLKDRDLLVLWEYDTGFARAFGGTHVGLKACELSLWSAVGVKISKDCLTLGHTMACMV